MLAGPGAAYAQAQMSREDLVYIQRIEDSMVTTTDSMYFAMIPDQRADYAVQFARQLIRALKYPNSYTYPFEKLSKRINIISPEDNSFRIFNWSVAPTDVTRRYYGAIQEAGEELKLHGLLDVSAELGKGVEDSILSRGRWFGALYYRIMRTEDEDGPVYTLFGLNAGGILSNKKVLDPLRFTERGPVFGAPVFAVPASEGGPVNRFVLEYKKEVQASMNWDAEIKAVYFDKLVSQVNDPHRKYTYVPSGPYDGFRWNKGKWQYLSDLIPVVPRKDGEAPIAAPRE